MIDLLLSFDDANDAILARAGDGKYPDQFASDPTIIEYLRPTRLPGRFGLVGSDRAHIISVGSDMVVVGFPSVGFRSGFGRN